MNFQKDFCRDRDNNNRKSALSKVAYHGKARYKFRFRDYYYRKLISNPGFFSPTLQNLAKEIFCQSLITGSKHMMRNIT
jgi:hypothetical protein